MAEERLHVVGEPDLEGRPVLRRDPSLTGPLFFSYGPINLVCGARSFLLVRGIFRASLTWMR